MIFVKTDVNTQTILDQSKPNVKREMLNLSSILSMSLPKGVQEFISNQSARILDLLSQRDKELDKTREALSGGVKRCRLVKEKVRYACSTFRDRIWFIACGLHNSASRTRTRINLDLFHSNHKKSQN